MEKKKRRPPINRHFLRAFVARRNGPPISEAAIEDFAARYLDGKSRKQREKAISGPWFAFLAEQLRKAVGRMRAMHAASHPQPN